MRNNCLQMLMGGGGKQLFLLKLTRGGVKYSLNKEVTTSYREKGGRR